MNVQFWKLNPFTKPGGKHVACLGRLGCLVVTAAVAVGAGYWWLNGGSIPIPGRSSPSSPSTASAESLTWHSLDEASSGGAGAVASLSRSNGPAYVELSPGDVAGFLAVGIARSLPRSASNPQVAIEGNHLHMRALVNMRDLAGEGALGTALGITLGSKLGDRDTLHIAGTVDVIRPGLMQYHVTRLAVRSVNIPQRLIPGIVQSMRARAGISDSLANDAIPIPLPRAIADIRIARDRITLYRATR